MAKKASTSASPKKPGKTVPPLGKPPQSLAIVKPKLLSEILGQQRAIAAISKACGGARMHHAWIFCGPTGIGKFTSALALGAALLDETSKVRANGCLEPDPGSDVRGRVLGAGHPDLHVITKELSRFDDDRTIREGKQTSIAKDVIEDHLLIPASRAPLLRSSGRASKVFIVDEAELLDRSLTNAPTQNSMLKTLEEPPEGTVIILVTSNEERLLPTVRSRCQRIVFTPLEAPAMTSWVASCGLEFPREHLAWLLSHAAGSPGMFERAVKDGLAEWHARIGPMLDASLQGRFVAGLAGAMTEFADAFSEGRVKANQFASKEAANHEAVSVLMAMVGEHLRSAMRSTYATNDERLRAARAVNVITEAQSAARANVSLQLVLSDLAAQLAEKSR